MGDAAATRGESHLSARPSREVSPHSLPRHSFVFEKKSNPFPQVGCKFSGLHADKKKIF